MWPPLVKLDYNFANELSRAEPAAEAACLAAGPSTGSIPQGGRPSDGARQTQSGPAVI